MSRTMEEIVKDDKEFLDMFRPFSEERKTNIIFYLRGLRDADAIKKEKEEAGEPTAV